MYSFRFVFIHHRLSQPFDPFYLFIHLFMFIYFLFFFIFPIFWHFQFSGILLLMLMLFFFLFLAAFLCFFFRLTLNNFVCYYLGTSPDSSSSRSTPRNTSRTRTSQATTSLNAPTDITPSQQSMLSASPPISSNIPSGGNTNPHPDQFYIPQQGPLTSMFDPTAGIYTPPNPSHMLIPNAAAPLIQNLDQQQQHQYYLTHLQQAQQQSFLPQTFTPSYQYRPDLDPQHIPQTPQAQTVQLDDKGNYLASPAISDLTTISECLKHFSTSSRSMISIVLPDLLFIDLVMQFIPIYEPLTFAVCSLGARSLSRTQSFYTQVAIDFKIKALNLLRQNLLYQGISEGALLCMLILGSIEMNELNEEAWEQHLEGLVKGINEMLESKAVLQNPIRYSNLMLIVDAAAYQDIMSAISNCKRPLLRHAYSNKWSFPAATPPCKTNYYQAINPILKIASDIICLGADLQESFPCTTYKLGLKNPTFYAVDKSYYKAEHHKQYNNILQCINQLHTQHIEDYSEHSVIAYSGMQAVLIYFMLRLDTTEFLLKLSPRVQQLQKIGLKWLLLVQDASSARLTSRSIIIWLIGIATESPADRAALLNRIQELYAEVPRSSLYLTMNFLTHFWKMRSSPKYASYTYRDVISLACEQTSFKVLL